MSDTVPQSRPQYRNLSLPQLLSYRLPPAGKASIMHRVSGALLFFCLPLVIVPLFAASVSAPEQFAAMREWVSNPAFKIVLLILIWAFLHHFCAGIRYLTLDLHLWDDKINAQRTAGVVFGVSLILTAIFGLKLFGAW